MLQSFRHSHASSVASYVHNRCLPVILILFAAGCSTVEKRTQITEGDPYSADRVSGFRRLADAQSAIESRARSYEAQGMSAEDARARAEMEYLRSSRGSPAGR